MARRPRGKQAPKQAGRSSAKSQPEFAPPANLRGESLEEWHRVVASLRDEGRLRGWMRGPLMRYCILWSRYVEATEAVAKHGMFTRNKVTKVDVVSCYSKAETDAHARLSRMEKQLGLTPEGGGEADPADAPELELG